MIEIVNDNKNDSQRWMRDLFKQQLFTANSISAAFIILN